MFCCPYCFTHAFLHDFIRANSTNTGNCSFCSTDTTRICDPSILIDLFQPILDLYTESAAGVPLNEQLQADWQLFQRNLSVKQQRQLLAVITSSKKYANLKVVSRHVHDQTYINKWERFKIELQHENRFFPKNAIDTIQLMDLLDYLAMAKVNNPKKLYRARVNRTSQSFSFSEMGKPPKEKALDGRANPKGIPYFYGASDEKTAIAETRPYKSEVVCVGEFRLGKKTNIIDIRDPKKTISPFGLDDDSLTLLYREHMPFLGHLSTALSIPVLPYKKDLEYLPTQYLCELIKDKNFDGIAFKSSLGKGDNYVIFNDSLLTGTKIETYSIEDTLIKPLRVRV
jgi:hypothetical protein